MIISYNCHYMDTTPYCKDTTVGITYVKSEYIDKYIFHSPFHYSYNRRKIIENRVKQYNKKT